MRDRIIEKLKKSGDWGEFSRCRFRRLIQRDNRAEYYPTTKEEAQNSGKVERRGQGNSSRQPSNYRTKKFRFNFKEILPAFPQNYRLVKQELDFYKNTNFRFRANASIRHMDRLKCERPTKASTAHAQNAKKILSSYSGKTGKSLLWRMLSRSRLLKPLIAPRVDIKYDAMQKRSIWTTHQQHIWTRRS